MREAIQQLQQCLGIDAVLQDPEQLRAYAGGGLTNRCQWPVAVLLPDSVAQIQSILRICKSRRLPVVTRGAGTGDCGGAAPRPNGVLLSLDRLNRILEVDPRNRTATVQAGVTHQCLLDGLAGSGLYSGAAYVTQDTTTVAGSMAKNTGAQPAAVSGHIINLKWMDADANLLSLGGSGYDAPGYDLLPLLMGSEGGLGIIVEVTLRLWPRPVQHTPLLTAIWNRAQAVRIVLMRLFKAIIPSQLPNLCPQYNDTECQYLHAIKTCFDPDLLLNPGTVLPLAGNPSCQMDDQGGVAIPPKDP